jgi:F0F1-type ATP synthase assembly protein I
MQIALSMALFVGLGYAADAWLGTLPWGTVAGAVVGMVVLFYHLLQVLDEMNRASDRQRKHQPPPSSGQQDPSDPTSP